VRLAFAFWTPVLITAGINSIIAFGLYFTMSSGPLSVAHAALAGMGGYLGAVLTTNFGWPFPLAIAAGAALGFATGLVLGLLILRMNELVAGLTTLGFGETMAVIAFNIDYIGGANAFTGIPLRTSLGLVYAVLALVLYAAWRYDHSRLGFGARASRDAPVTAAAMGIHVARVKVLTFGIGAAIAALGGVLRAHFILVQGPEDMGFFVSVGYLIFVVFGGSYTFWGPLFGAMTLTILPEVLRFSSKERFIIYGVLLTVMVILRPQGLITRIPTGRAPRRFGFLRRWRGAPASAPRPVPSAPARGRGPAPSAVPADHREEGSGSGR
jgi:branched-chain amino acid transport system permease protein